MPYIPNTCRRCGASLDPGEQCDCTVSLLLPTISGAEILRVEAQRCPKQRGSCYSTTT